MTTCQKRWVRETAIKFPPPPLFLDNPSTSYVTSFNFLCVFNFLISCCCLLCLIKRSSLSNDDVVLDRANMYYVESLKKLQ